MPSIPSDYPTIIVTARVRSGGYGGSASSGFQAGGIYDSLFIDMSPPPVVDDPPIDGSFQPPPTLFAEDGYAIEPGLAQRFRLSILSIQTKLGNAPGNSVIATSNNQLIAFDELYAKYLTLDFRISFTLTFPPGFGGTVGRIDDGYLSTIKNSTVQGYDSIPNGITFMILHELSHITQASSDFHEQKLNSYIARGGVVANWGSSPEFIETERYANRIARDIALALNIPLMNVEPTHGY
jgi:hypothetical protein